MVEERPWAALCALHWLAKAGHPGEKAACIFAAWRASPAGREIILKCKLRIVFGAQLSLSVQRATAAQMLSALRRLRCTRDVVSTAELERQRNVLYSLQQIVTAALTTNLHAYDRARQLHSTSWYCMAGHNKWSKIKRKKAANDETRSRIWTKVSQAITAAATSMLVLSPHIVCHKVSERLADVKSWVSQTAWRATLRLATQ